MYHITDIRGHESEHLLRDIFLDIVKGNTILFLGAGASITDKQEYLSRHLMEYHKAETGIGYKTDNIVDYVNVLSRNVQFDRGKFDDIVDRCLRNLKPDRFHETIARMPWKEIITTNLDTVVERVFDKTFGTSDQNKVLKPARNISENAYNPSNDEVKYVKLNGCISDRSKYPFVFSSKDFESANRYYRVVLSSLENMSPRIQFLAVGYSFRDPFAKYLLERFDRYNYRNKRDMILVDPIVQEDMLPYLESNNIRIVRCSAGDFFQEFENWESSNEELIKRRRRSQFRKKDNSPLNLSRRLSNRLGGSLIQISPHSRFEYLSPNQFYNGDRPSYFAIRQDYDVIRTNLQEKIFDELESFFTTHEITIPIVALTGSYGTGKTTFCYRLAHSVLNSDSNVTIFEILDPQRIRSVDLQELINAVDTDKVLLLFDECEIDSFFKAMIELRSNLSIQQLAGRNIVMLVPIRENILQRLTHNRSYSNLHQRTIDAFFNEAEAADLIEKLDESNIIAVRDERERRILVRRVVQDYDGDAFVSLLSIVTNGRHNQILRSAYDQLSIKARESFLYTSLLYRFKVLMPSSLLMKLVSKDWGEFKRDVIEYDAKGILIQEEKAASGTEPDLYFRTRHPVISDLLIQTYLGDLDKRFSAYEKVFRKIRYSYYSSGLIVDVLKAMRLTDEFTQSKIDKLFDICANEFSTDPHFTLHYAINLQYRDSEQSLVRAIERIVEAESYLERRNHRLTHRRAVLNYRLAELLDKQQVTRSAIQTYIDEARELFRIKLIEDPFSIFSYREYLRFEIWHLETLSHAKEATLDCLISIESLLNQAKMYLQEDLETIAAIESNFRQSHVSKSSRVANYGHFINELYRERHLRPYALMLKYYNCDRNESHNLLPATVNELEQYAHLNEVAKLLFRHYGRALYVEDNRVKLDNIARSNTRLIRQDPVRFHYFLAVSCAYDRRFADFRRHISEIPRRFGSRLHMHDYWKDEGGTPIIFDAIIEKRGEGYWARIVDLQYGVPISRRNLSRVSTDSSHKRVQLRFHTGGMNAFVVDDTYNKAV